MRRRTAVVLAAAALALGACCIVLGRAVLADGSRLAASAASLAAPEPSPPRAGQNTVASTLLGTGGDWRAVRAAAAYIRTRPTPHALSRLERSFEPFAAAGSGRRRAWAATLLATIEFARAGGGGRDAASHMGAATRLLQQAVQADPGSEDAKRDLELLLTLQQPRRPRSPRHGAGHGRGHARPKHARPARQQARPAAGKASLSPPGSGW